jgi:prolyl oligopeptidase
MFSRTSLALCLIGVASTSCRHLPTPPTPTEGARFDYPATRREDVVDVLHGIRVAHPYRWLEGSGVEVTSWFEAQDERAAGRLRRCSVCRVMAFAFREYGKDDAVWIAGLTQHHD